MDARRAASFCLAVGVAAWALGGCGGAPVTGVSPKLHGCPDFRPPEALCARPPSFARDVRPILAKSCVPCHYGAPGPDALWPLTDYGDVASWNDLIKTSLLNCSQPPASSVFPFTEEDRATIVTWTLCNHPP